jgi:large subunit ribosomal protein L9
MSKLKHKKCEKTKVILTTRVRGLGNRGDTIDVAKGYFRNYLRPTGKAVCYNDSNINLVSTTANVHKQTSVNFGDFIEKLDNKTMFVSRDASGNGILYASIKSKDITDILSKDWNLVIDKNRVIINNIIKTLGLFKIQLDLDEQIITMNIVVGRSLEDAKKIYEESQKAGSHE